LEENGKLKEKIAILENRLEDTQIRLTKVEKELPILKRKIELQHFRLLVGSIAYNYVEAAIEFVFGRGSLKELRKRLHSLKDIENEHKTTDEESRWDTFNKNYYSEEFDDVLEEFRGDKRTSVAHPTTIEEDGENPPQPKELTAIVDDLYKQKSKKDFRAQAHQLIHQLDQLARILGRDLLQ